METGSSDNHLEFVNYAKALAIILMVAGHSWVGSDMEAFVGVFHVPLFFFMSGFCFKEKYIHKPLLFIKRKINGIYWPYIKWGILFLLLHNIFIYYHLMDGDILDAQKHYELLRYILRMRHEEQLLGGFWFMKCLFWGNIIFFSLKYICRKAWIVVCTCLLMAMLFLKKDIHLPVLDINHRDLFAAFYIAAGNLLTTCYTRISKKMDALNILNQVMLIIACFGLLIISYAAGITRISQNAANPVMAIIGIAGIFILCRLLPQRITPLGYIGTHTLEILTLHFIGFKIVSVVLIALTSQQWNNVAEFPTIQTYSKNGLWILYIFVGVSIPLAYCKIKDIIHKLYYRE